MIENADSSGNARESVSDAPDQTQTEKKDSVAYETYRKAISEKKKRDAELAEARQRLEMLEAEKQSALEEDLVKKEEYQKLLDIRQKELDSTKSKLSEYDKRWNDGTKLDSFLNYVRAKHGELPKKYWALIDLDAIAIDPDTGIADDRSIEEIANSFVESYPEVIATKDGPGLPADAARKGTSGLSLAEWKALPNSTEMKKRLGDVVFDK